MFSGKTILITGGTGSFGAAVLDELISSNIREIRVFSRDEKKQDDLRKKYDDSRLKLYIGDVREKSSLNEPMYGVDFVFHAAALKQVPSCEFYPQEAFRTNVIGTENVIDCGISNGVSKIVCLSTDKAVYPINAMGISKAMMEKIALAKSRNSKNTLISITRYGNVMASRGSVIPLFISQIKAGLPVTVTDPEMTRFMMTLEDAVNLVFYAIENSQSGEIYVQKAPAATTQTLVDALLDIFSKGKHEVKIIGTRHGEKLYETLMSREELALSVDLLDYVKILPDNRDLNYLKYYSQGTTGVSYLEDYNSHNTRRLDVEEMKAMLLRVPYVRSALEIQ